VAAGWDADRYQRQFGFFSAFGGDLLGLLDPRPGEAVLDLGCGTGELAVAEGGGGRPAKLHRQTAADRDG
jgi:SAM-dependent methyltransferase